MCTPGSSSIYTTDPSPSPSTVEHRINSIQNTVYLRVPVLALYCSSYTQGNCLRSSDVTYPMWSFVQVTLLFFQEKKKPESLGRRHTVTDLRTRDFYGTFPYNALLHKNRYTRDRFSSLLKLLKLHIASPNSKCSSAIYKPWTKYQTVTWKSRVPAINIWKLTSCAALQERHIHHYVLIHFLMS